jgi:outer membrane protein OmpA-like peptidoglycan-associated protein
MKTITIFFRNLVLVVAVCFASVAFAQSPLQKARDLKNNYEYQKAIDQYTSYFSTNAASSDDMRELVECYNLVNDLVSAELWLKKIIDSGFYTASDVWNYANALKSEAKYKDAMEQFTIYSYMENGNKLKAEKQIEGCSLALQWIDDPTFFDLANEKSLNSENSDFGLIKFGNTFIITSDRKTADLKSNEFYGWTGKPYLKLYSGSASGKALAASNLSKIEPLNNNYHNGPAMFDAASSKLFFTRTKMVKVTKPVNNDPTSWIEKPFATDYVNRLEIFSSNYSQNQWADPVPFQYNNVEEYSVGHPAVTEDGSTLYFVSDMPGGYGGTDIYFCEKLSTGGWSKPQNAGPAINTDGKEVFPFVDDDGTLYFSSDGHAGMGGLDIFKATGSKSSWSEPENMKSPINSSKDDFSIYFTDTGAAGYLSSNRSDGLGDDDIYSFEYNPPTSLILAVTTKEKLDDNSLVPLAEVNLTLTNKSLEASEAFKTDDKGLSFIDLSCASSFEIKGDKDGYFFTKSKKFETAVCKTRHDTTFVELVFDKIVLNKPIVLENIYYDFDKWNIRSDAASELDKLVVILQDNPGIKIELGSHTDCRGSNKYNQTLSQKRAESAVAYIISRGIDKSRITAKGYGETQLRNSCADGVDCSESEHQLNRRTEFKVTGGVLK